MGMGIQQEQQYNNKRREQDEEHQQGQDGGSDHQRRRTRVVVMEYTAEDAARFDEEMACVDKQLDDLEAKMSAFQSDPATAYREPAVSFTSPCLQQEPEPEPEVLVGEGGRRRVSKASINTIRAFTRRSRYHPFPERLLSRFFTRAAANRIRLNDRITSKLYAQSQARAREILHRYDAKGYLEYDADGNIDLST